jgi:hypothetical protein
MAEQKPDTEKLSVNDVIADLQGFGVEDFQEILTLECNGKAVKVRLSNLTTEQERLSILANEDVKGYEWMQNVRLEILSRSISWINNVDLHQLKGRDRLVVDPTLKPPVERDIQVVLREILRGWGQEIIMILWRVLMVHSQSIEDRLFAKFPDAAQMTEVQRRFEERAMEEIEQSAKAAIAEHVMETFGTDDATDK